MTDGDNDDHAGQDQAGRERHDGHDHGNCEQALAELYTFLDGELTDIKRSQINGHLDDCSPCLEAFDFEAELRMVIKHRCRDEVPESLRLRVAARLMTFDHSSQSIDVLGDPPP